ncbi:hypothetical protein L6452_00938 [Arctium lappa]|uniref:Uncharacterized protein n=1 Tax=Arctium lappa TaxID=4217 RepID=A0ACB9FG48_ARCLA|nr:hypothetical protein L6452_00938 [Arctium lappa]
MSGLIDMWTSEVKKLRNNNGTETQTPHGSTPSQPESPNHHQLSGSGWWSLLMKKRVNSPPSTFFPAAASEASLSMFVDCFSP